VEYVYDLVGKIKQVTDPTGVYGFAYDNMGRLVGTTTRYSFLPNQTFTNAYTYDAASNRTGFTAPDGSTNAYSYDTLNRLSGLTNSLTGAFGFSYDALSRRTQLTRPNGVNTNYGYDLLSRLLSVLHQSGQTTLDGASYTYDAAGNRTSKTNYLNGITENYTYDPLYELTQVTQGSSTTETYSYDPVGNRLSSLGMSPYSYNSSNELTSTPSGSYTYDANGNTLSDAQGRSFTWDFENRLTQAVLPGANGGTMIFKYDPFGRRIQKSGLLGTSSYLYDGANALETIDESGGEIASYTQTEEIDESLAMLQSSTMSYYHADGLGSVTSLSDATGAIVQTYLYDTFGNKVSSSGSLVNPFQYTGREFDSETSLYYYRARYFDPSLGRFLSEDSSKENASGSTYMYVENSPVLFVDPSGMEPQNAGLVIGPHTTQQEIAQFNAGFAEALNRLKNPECRKLFSCKKNKDLDPAQVLQDTNYRIIPLAGNAGAVTNPSYSVFLSPTGPFFQTSTTAFIPFDNPQLTGMRQVQFDTPADIAAFVLLHELGHEVGIFPPDLFPFINGRHSLRVLEDCFKKGAKVEQ